VRRFLLEHLVGERNLARNTQQSYRDSLTLLIPFIARKVHKTVDQLEIGHFTAEHVRQFLQHLEEARGCSISTRNQRLAAIHALAHFIAQRGPECIEWCGQIQAVPFKRTATASITYLEKSEMHALLAAPARNSPQGRRDYALLLFLYNTGARASEAAQLSIGDLRLAEAPCRDHSSVQIRGKGNKLRFCPLWSHTVCELEALIRAKVPDRACLYQSLRTPTHSVWHSHDGEARCQQGRHQTARIGGKTRRPSFDQTYLRQPPTSRRR